MPALVQGGGVAGGTPILRAAIRSEPGQATTACPYDHESLDYFRNIDKPWVMSPKSAHAPILGDWSEMGAEAPAIPDSSILNTKKRQSPAARRQ